jgi:protein involved in polysaccharide export with SLBB domain
MSQSVFVSGAVARPGRYGFERIPGLIDALSQAGGALSRADLSRVQMVRRMGTARTLRPASPRPPARAHGAGACEAPAHLLKTERPAGHVSGGAQEKGGRRSQNRGPHASFIELAPHARP